ncbi:response regulator [Candidatus Latescibacterota bacterium]
MEKIKKNTILVVDDTVENIDVLNGILKEDYKIKVALNGEKALKIAESKEPPDLILLDVMMPDMDGYEVCVRLKSNSATAKIPVIFVTAKTEVEDETMGFELGAVDYITKPVSPPTVQARVKTHIELFNSRNSIEQMLSKTLMGSIKLLSDILALANPQAFSQASRLKRYARDIAAYLKLSEVWKYEMAALLSQIGCVTIPHDILEKILADEKLTIKEKEMYKTIPVIGQDLLDNIPRLNLLAKMIGQQQETLSTVKAAEDVIKWDPIVLGGQILKVAIEYDKLISVGVAPRMAIIEMKNRGGIYPPVLLNAISETQVDLVEVTDMSVKIDELRDGMILLDDIITTSDIKLFKSGSEVTSYMLKLIQRYTKYMKIREPIRIQVVEKKTK